MIVTVLAESVVARLREQWLKGQVVSLYLQDTNLSSWNKQIKIKSPTFLSEEMILTVMRLFKQYSLHVPIRNVGVRVSELRYRFGHFSVSRAIEHVDKSLTRFCPHEENVIHPYSYFR